MYACLAADVVDERGAIVAFEPHSVRRGSLHRDIRRNGARISVRSEALANTERRAAFGYRIIPDTDEEPTDAGGFEVRLVRGDRLISSGVVPQPTVLKIDVEGAELETLRGLSESLRSERCRLVYCELHNRIEQYDGSWEELRGLLTDAGFAIETIDTRVGERYEQPFILAEK